MKLYKIETENLMTDGGATFGVIPKVMWQKQYPADDDNYCNLTMRSLLVDTGDRRILIDTGIGNKQSEKFYSYYRLNGDATLLGSLNEAGYSPEEITDVILTHLHFDHDGGHVIRDSEGNLKLLFSNARHWTTKAQWSNYLNPNIREGAVYFPEDMMPVKEAGKLKIIEEEGEYIPGIEFRIFNGHTPGMIVPVITYKNTKVIYGADLIPLMANIPLPWVSAYDLYPLISIEEKKKLLNEAYENGYVLFFEHDLYNECCTLIKTDKGIKPGKPFDLSEIDNIIQ
ncbi:MAG: MBL fold metallo-hydrolase [Chlorobi bacterium]|nr:MBL fold metallo-hydrolase [Chlorobiota bacterium]